MGQENAIESEGENLEDLQNKIKETEKPKRGPKPKNGPKIKASGIDLNSVEDYTKLDKRTLND